MRLPILALALLLLTALPADAQFAVLEGPTIDPDLPPSAPLDASGFSWKTTTLLGESATQIYVIEEGTAATAGAESAVAWSLWQRTSGGGLMPVLGRTVLSGTLDRVEALDLTGDSARELVLRRGIREATATVTRFETTVHRVGATTGTTRLLASWSNGPAVTEFWAPWPDPASPGLVVASFGGHAGGTTASPDAYLRFAYDITTDSLVRGADLVLPPVPMSGFVAVPLRAAEPPTLVSLREYPQNAYKQQLWAQLINPQGFFDNRPIGQGNNLELLAPHPKVPALLFAWLDPTPKVPVTHLTALGLDAESGPRTPFDHAFPWNLTLLAHAWGHFLSDPDLPAQTLPQLALLTRQVGGDSPVWLILITFTEDPAIASIEYHQPGLDLWRTMIALDVDGDGTEELIGTDGDRFQGFSFLTRKATIVPRMPIPGGLDDDGREDLLDLGL